MPVRLVLHSRRDRILAALLIAAVCEIAWVIYLSQALPRHYVADHWDLAWVGLDVGEISMLVGAAWAAWRQRAVLIVFLIAAATMFLLDAWFDVTTAHHGDELQSVLLAVLAELPSALILLWVARLAARRLIKTHLGDSALSSTPVRKILLVETTDVAAREATSNDGDDQK